MTDRLIELYESQVGETACGGANHYSLPWLQLSRPLVFKKITRSG